MSVVLVFGTGNRTSLYVHSHLQNKDISDKADKLQKVCYRLDCQTAVKVWTEHDMAIQGHREY